MMGTPCQIRVMVLPSWYPPEGGEFFREHAQALAGEGYDVDVLVNRLIGLNRFRRSDFAYLKKYRISQYGMIREVWSYMIKIPLANRLSVRLWIGSTFRHFRRYVRRCGVPGLILAHSSVWAGVVANRIFRSYGIPYLIVEHRSRFIMNTGEARRLVERNGLSLIRRAFTESRMNICVSENLKEGLEGLFPGISGRLMVIPNMVDTSFFRPLVAEKDKATFVFLYVGNLERVKGLDLLLRAFRGVRDEKDNTVLRVAGRGRLYRELKNQVSLLGLSGCVSLLGYLDRRSLLEEYQNAHAFVLPSRFEAFGVVLIEAMAAGLPVIATRSGGPESIVPSGCGILAEIEDAGGLKSAMVRMINEYTEFRAGEIRNHVLEHYSKPAVARRYHRLLQEICHDQD